MSQALRNVECLQNNVRYQVSPESLMINGTEIIAGPEKSVLSLVILKNTVVIVLDDPDLYGKSVVDCYNENGRKGNVVCYSTTGKAEMLWRIDDLVDTPIRLPFCSGHMLTEQEMISYAQWHGVQFQNGCEYFIALNNGGGKYIINVSDKKLVKMIYTRD